MKTPVLFAIATLLAGVLGTAVVFWGSNSAKAPTETAAPRPTKSTAPARTTASAAPVSAKPAGDLEARLAKLEAEVAALRQSMQAGGTDPRRVVALEKSVKTLQSAMEGVSIEKASAERQALFAGKEGYLKANEYFEAGKFAIAGEGYITFLQNHPDHPDRREIMKKARDAFLKAGFKEKGFWMHDEMMKSFPEHGARDVEELAVLEKEAGLYDGAITHMAQAADMAPSVEERLWKRLYWAWYIQLRDGAPAGIAALQEVQREIATSGVNNPKLNEHATRRMQEWQAQLSRK